MSMPLAREIGCLGTSRSESVANTTQARGSANVELMFERIVRGGEPFWSAVYEPFMARDLTRRDIRELVRLGLEHTRGNYKLLVSPFNMAPEIQEVPELPAQVSVPRAVPGIPDGFGPASPSGGNRLDRAVGEFFLIVLAPICVTATSLLKF